MIEEAIVDAYTESEQAVGFHTMIARTRGQRGPLSSS
jgi:hypothetical protein